jgi:transposase
MKASHLHPVKHGASWRTKSQIQALNRTAPILPLRPGIPEKQTHDYVRNGTTTLFAALEVATGKVVQDCRERHTNADFLAFLKQVAKAYPRKQLHVVCDNYATHKHPTVKAWLAKNRRVTLHFTPTSGSWLNLIEIFFGIITRQAIRRGSFDSVKELVAAIERFITGWNERCEPFVWTKAADEILEKAEPKNRKNNFSHATLVLRKIEARNQGKGHRSFNRRASSDRRTRRRRPQRSSINPRPSRRSRALRRPLCACADESFSPGARSWPVRKRARHWPPSALCAIVLRRSAGMNGPAAMSDRR